MNFEEKSEELLDKIAENVYALAELFAEEQLRNFAKWMADQNTAYTEDEFASLVDEFIKEQRT